MTRSTTGPAPAASAAPLPSPKERRRLREARALSEEQVAAVVGVTPATVHAWETGRTSPRGRRRAAYARLIGFAEHRPAPPHPVEASGSSTMSPTEPGTRPTTSTQVDPVPEPRAQDAPTPEPPARATPSPHAPAPASLGVSPRQEGSAPETAAPDGPDPVPQPALTAEQAYDVLYGRTAPGLTRQVFLLTGRRKLTREAVEHAFRIAWQRWPEVARDRDPAGWVRAASYEYAMSPWHRLRRAHRRADPPPEDPARRALLDALLGLPPSHRRTLLLHDGVGLGLPETAAETEASTPAAASRLLHARAAVAEQLPEPAEPPAPSEPDDRSVPLHDRLDALALAEEVPAPPPAPAVRAGGERVAELWTRAALCFGALLIGSTAFTLHTAPTRYEQPLAPAQQVGGVPAQGGPEKLTPQDLELQESLRGELAHGPERLLPRIP
ncbi:helix-turn-helix domain-containing protein [Streptomyces sp. HB132]|uniref:helix-turn-helix domain-containing protein n=1 Tax=Streptomyces sp. HB132 TaxID=767388 RepID=UPI0019604CD9|nr:helix-turn-helix domain-containing protein [Streptomyces sp. HB132]MBM7437157.1 DNA-directed RNA polymerase specialized sigma24 family protein/DNA-binding XRE family transcriptional regulator [Streptomyces sp. HB132]